MGKIGSETPKAPMGLISSLWKGVEIVNTHPWLLVLPVLLDTALWFGPRLSVSAPLAPFIQALQSAVASAQGDPASIDIIRQWAASFNLFSLLSFVPLYPPSLMTSHVILQTPLGEPSVLQVSNLLVCAGLALGMALLSILIGSVYWVGAGQATQEKGWSFRELINRWIRAVIVIFILICGVAVFYLVVLNIALFTSFFLGLVWTSGATIVFQLLFLLGSGLSFWLVLFLIFSVHGAILFRDGILRSFWNSIESARWMYPLSMWIPIFLFGLYMLTVNIWSLPGDKDWIGFIGILGNAYTSSILVTASLAYYQDKRRWIEEIRALLQTRGSTPMPLNPNS